MSDGYKRWNPRETKEYWLELIGQQPGYVRGCIREAIVGVGHKDGLGWLRNLVECIGAERDKRDNCKCAPLPASDGGEDR